MRKLLLNFVPGEQLALVQELASFDNPIQLDICWRVLLNFMSMIQSMVACSMQSGFKYFGVSSFATSEVSSRGGK